MLSLVIGGCTGTCVRVDDSDVRTAAEGSYLYGPINGYLQIPSGGSPGTTSIKQPSFGEIGLNTVSMGDLEGEVGMGNHAGFIGARLVRDSGDATLSQTLVSHGTTFPAGSDVSSSVRLDWYQVGYRYRFAYRYGDGSGFAIQPAADFALLDFDYRLSSPPGLVAARSFSKGTPRLGIEGSWMPMERVSLWTGVTGSLPIAHTPMILSTNLTAGYEVWHGPSWGLTGLFGIAYDQVNFEDQQHVPNRIHAELGPSLQVGLTVRWRPFGASSDSGVNAD